MILLILFLDLIACIQQWFFDNFLLLKLTKITQTFIYMHPSFYIIDSSYIYY